MSAFNNTLVYHGGRILANTEVFAVFYPSAWGPVPYMAETIDFYSSITKSSWWDIMKQYNTPTQTVGDGKFVGSYLETGPTSSYLNNNKEIPEYIRGLITKGIVKPNNNTYIAMHFGPYIQVIAGGLGSCGYWCGYHSNVDIGDLVPGVPRVAIGGIPDFFVGGGCDRCGGSDQLGKTLATASHEIAEATLDPDGNSSGWDEVADMCGDQAKVTAYNGKTFEVQNLWSNAHDRCVFSPNAVNTKTTTRPATTVVKTSTTTTMKPTTTTTTTTTTAAATTSKPTTTTTTTTTTAAPSSTKTTKTTTTTTTTTKTNPTTTKPAGGISNGVACTSFGARACNNACTCNYASNNALVWQCNPTNISC